MFQISVDFLLYRYSHKHFAYLGKLFQTLKSQNLSVIAKQLNRESNVVFGKLFNGAMVFKK